MSGVMSVFGLSKRRLCEEEAALTVGELLALAEDVRRMSRQCASCGATAGKACHGCGIVKYCGRECQAAGWPAHQLVCKTMNADREISKTVGATNLVRRAAHATMGPRLARPSLLPLAGIVSRLRSDGHVKAYDAAVHLSFLLRSCDLAPVGERDALCHEIAASGCIPLLVSSLAVGGLRACRAVGLLCLLHEKDGTEADDAIVVAGALPLLVKAIALPTLHADLNLIWTIRATAIASTELLGALALRPVLWPAIVAAGAVPALTAHLKLSGEAWPPAWPVGEPQRFTVIVNTAKTMMDLSSADAAVAAEVAAAGFDADELRRLYFARPPVIQFQTMSIRHFFTSSWNGFLFLARLARYTVAYFLHFFGLWEYQGRVIHGRRRR